MNGLDMNAQAHSQQGTYKTQVIPLGHLHSCSQDAPATAPVCMHVACMHATCSIYCTGPSMNTPAGMDNSKRELCMCKAPMHAHLGTLRNHSIDANQRMIADGGALDDGTVTNGHIAADLHGRAVLA